MNKRKVSNTNRDNYVSLYASKKTWGWFWIVDELHKKLSYLDKNYTVQQIKEKFGGLRYYYEPTDKTRQSIVYDIMNDIVREAEHLAWNTCMDCGNSKIMSNTSLGLKYDSTVKLRDDNYWIRTLCDTCDDKRNNKYELDGEE